MKSGLANKNSPQRTISLRAKDLAEAGRTSAAIAMLEQGLKTYPDDPFFISHLGHLYRRLGNYEKALFYFGKGCQLEPNNMFNALSLGTLLDELGRHQHVEIILKAAHQRNPQDALVLHGLANALMRQHKDAEAEVAVKKAHELRPHDVRTIILLSNIYLRRRSYDAFNQLMDKTSSLKVTDTSYHYIKALGKFLQHEKEMARMAAQDSLRIRFAERAAMLYMACAEAGDPGLADLREYCGETKYRQLLARSAELRPDASLLELIDPKFLPKASKVTSDPLYTRPVNRAAVTAVAFPEDI